MGQIAFNIDSGGTLNPGTPNKLVFSTRDITYAHFSTVRVQVLIVSSYPKCKRVLFQQQLAAMPRMHIKHQTQQQASNLTPPEGVVDYSQSGSPGTVEFDL